MWGQTPTTGKGTNGRMITGLRAEFRFKTGVWGSDGFFIPAKGAQQKVTWRTKDRRCVE